MSVGRGARRKLYRRGDEASGISKNASTGLINPITEWGPAPRPNYNRDLLILTVERGPPNAADPGPA